MNRGPNQLGVVLSVSYRCLAGLLVLASCVDVNSQSIPDSHAQSNPVKSETDVIESVSPANCETPSTIEPRRVYLQQVSTDSLVVSWTGGHSFVCVWNERSTLVGVFAGVQKQNHFSAHLSDLSPATRYFYSIGGQLTETAYSMTTAPESGDVPADGAVNMLLLGDSGTAGVVGDDGEFEHEGEALAVLEGFRRHQRSLSTGTNLDLILLLGDNAYPSGTDEQWQVSFFDVYREELSGAGLLPTIGNHEMGYAPFDVCLFMDIEQCTSGPFHMPLPGSSRSSDPSSYDGDGDGPDGTTMPYLDIFEIPMEGELR